MGYALKTRFTVRVNKYGKPIYTYLLKRADGKGNTLKKAVSKWKQLSYCRRCGIPIVIQMGKDPQGFSPTCEHYEGMPSIAETPIPLTKPAAPETIHPETVTKLSLRLSALDSIQRCNTDPGYTDWQCQKNTLLNWLRVLPQAPEVTGAKVELADLTVRAWKHHRDA